MKKLIVITFFFIIILSPISYSTEEVISSEIDTLNIQSIIKSGKEYTKDVYKDIDLDELLNSAVKGEIDNKGVYKSVLSLLGDEIINAITSLGTILIIIVISSILKTISDNLENKSVSEITYYIVYILIVTLIMSNFAQIINDIKNAISNLVGIVNSLVPVLLALMVATGSTISATTLEPIILTIILFVANTITTVILPIILISTTIGIISNLSKNIQIDKLAKTLKSGVLWFLGITITAFTTILSLEGNLTSSVDGIAAKTLKTTVSTFVPIVGKALSESADTVLGCTAILKNAIGIVGIVIVVGICAMPIIKLTVLTATYKFAAAICQPLADKRIINLLEQMSSTFKVLLGVIFFVSALFIIGLGITVKISNSSMMYR